MDHVEKIFYLQLSPYSIMIVLTKLAFKMIQEHSLQESPREACGILAGTTVENPRITNVFCCSNVDENPNEAYTISPNELLKVIDEIEGGKNGLEFMGFYHSHPFSSPTPSSVDARQANWDGFVYLIFSVPKDKLRCWRWREKSGFMEEEVVIA
jgi:proteasome lid subunit RPN8/RPN11